MKAFPLSNMAGLNQQGMDLRDYFAATALPAVIADPDTQKTSKLLELPFSGVAASLAYTFADAMMEARK
jgi:hypothetical protein